MGQAEGSVAFLMPWPPLPSRVAPEPTEAPALPPRRTTGQQPYAPVAP
jgi:hypothetical protein